MFELLRKRIMEEDAQRRESAKCFIENGYCETWAEEHKKKNDNGIERESTPLRWKQYKNGEINREKAVELATKRRLKEIDKTLITDLDRLLKARDAEDVESVSISVEWRRNRTWGYNPTATVTIETAHHREQYSGTASGCGYDKLTAAIGSALNQSASIKKMLYTAKEKSLSENYPEFTQTESNRNFINYGAGYGVLPYFEGGVGMTSFYGVFEKCGYKCTVRNETKHTDFYYFEKA
jgi:hypothetical protein